MSPLRSGTGLRKQFRALSIATLWLSRCLAQQAFSSSRITRKQAGKFEFGLPKRQLNALSDKSITQTACSFATSLALIPTPSEPSTSR